MWNQMYYGGYSHMSSWSLFGGILSIIFWIFVVIVIIRLLRGSHGGWHHHGRYGHGGMGQGNSGLNILNERYAKGEINKEEYEQKKKDLLG